jgi:outer membrane protein assembly factor BamB
MTTDIAKLRLVCLLLALSLISASAEDWPTYRHDHHRSGTTAEQLDATGLKQHWVYQSAAIPQMAFSGPAPRDFYNSPDKDLKPRMDFDRVFNVAVVGERLFFGSSTDDAIYCLDARTGKVEWVYITDGPVRLAPTCDEGRVYAGSDDGHVYCLTGDDGTLSWKKRVADRDYRVPSDGKFISLWPVRSGIVVDNGIAYCGAGFLPSEASFIAALDADTGNVGPKGTWRQTRSGEFSLQGFLLASDDRLYLPAGRSPPYMFERSTGKPQGQISGGGGTYCLLDDQQQLIYGPSRNGGLELSNAKAKNTVVTFAGNHIIVAAGISYLHTDTELRALDRVRYNDLTATKIKADGRRRKLSGEIKKFGKDVANPKAKALIAEMRQAQLDSARAMQELPKTLRWRSMCRHPHALILAGKTLFAGGSGEVAAYSALDGRVLWKAPVSGNAFGLAVASGKLFVSTDNGSIHAFGLDAVR